MLESMTNTTGLPSIETCSASTNGLPAGLVGDVKAGLVQVCSENLIGVPRGNDGMNVVMVGVMPVAITVSQEIYRCECWKRCPTSDNIRAVGTKFLQGNDRVQRKKEQVPVVETHDEDRSDVLAML
jgi:hypothetical protein